MRIAIRDLFHISEVGIWVFDDSPGQQRVAKPISLEFEPYEKNISLPEPTLSIPQRHLHTLIKSASDELEISSLGRALMPNRDKQIESIKYHLEDMRKLVFQRCEASK